MANRSHSLRQSIPAICAAAACVVSVMPARSQEVAQERTPYYIGASQAFTHDSNVYRTPTNESSETISSTGILVGFDQPIGRQRVYADASAEINRYRSNDLLDNKSYAANAGVDWETIEFLSGNFRYNVRNSLADFGTLEGSTAASDQITQQFQATARFGMTSRLAFDASYEHRDLKYSNDVYANRNFKQDAVSAGLLWGTRGLLTFGLAYRATKGRTPEYQNTPPFENETNRRDIDFTTVWTPSGASTLNLRISSTKETETLPSDAERSGWTGALGWDYRPTAKLGFVTSIIRDTGTEATFLAPPPGGTTPLSVDESTLSTTFALQARYDFSSKITLSGDARYRDGTLGNGEKEKVGGYGLGLNYDPTRAVSLSCSINYETREVASATAYKATISGCSAQVTLR